jgi:hypothetical protein
MIIDAGSSLGVLKSMIMGSAYTALTIEESNGFGTLHHTVIVENDVAKKLCIGELIRVKIERY